MAAWWVWLLGGFVAFLVLGALGWLSWLNVPLRWVLGRERWERLGEGTSRFRDRAASEVEVRGMQTEGVADLALESLGVDADGMPGWVAVAIGLALVAFSVWGLAWVLL